MHIACEKECLEAAQHSCQLWEMKMREILYMLETDERSELFGFGGALYEPPVGSRGGAPENF